MWKNWEKCVKNIEWAVILWEVQFELHKVSTNFPGKSNFWIKDYHFQTEVVILHYDFRMPRNKIIVRPFLYKYEEWVEAGGRQHHVDPPPDTAGGPFWQAFDEDDTEVYTLVRDGIRYFISGNNVRPELFNVYHISIEGVGVRMDARCSELANREEVIAYFDMPQWD